MNSTVDLTAGTTQRFLCQHGLLVTVVCEAWQTIEPFKKTAVKRSSKLLIPYGEGGGIR
jgi:hypothetical protein